MIFFVHSVFWEYIFGRKNAWNTTNLKMRQKSVYKIFNQRAFFFFLLTGATWYYPAIYIVLTYFAWFTGYEYDIFEVISNLHVQESKFGGKFGKKSYKNWTPPSSWSFFFPCLINPFFFSLTDPVLLGLYHKMCCSLITRESLSLNSFETLPVPGINGLSKTETKQKQKFQNVQINFSFALLV